MNDDPASKGRLEYFLSVLLVATLLAGFALIGRVVTRVAVAIEAANAAQLQTAVTFTPEHRVILERIIADKVRQMRRLDEIAASFSTQPPREKPLLEILRETRRPSVAE